MRRRITRTLFAAAAAGVTVSTLGFAAAGSASAAVSSKAQPPTIGTTIGSTSSAGYEASGRDFRFITSTIRVPDTDFLTGLYPQEHIQLSTGRSLSPLVTVTPTPGPGSSPASWPGRSVTSARP